jgi:serine-type D-Ala-D-Ala carboxypeptidase/endopeptidase (penicillin-binding protein 4)
MKAPLSNNSFIQCNRSAIVSFSFALLFGLLTSTGCALPNSPKTSPEKTPKVPANEPTTLDQLQKRISGIVTDPRYNAGLFGIKIASLDTGKVLYQYNAEKLCSPASNSKLYTMALALDRLGADYRIKTSLYSQSKPDENGVLKGDLVVYGRGDPTIGGEYNGEKPLKALEPLVAVLTNAGVKQISGDLIGDDSYFHSPEYGSGWDWGDFDEYYGAEISALTFNSNVVQLLVKPGDGLDAPLHLVFDPPTTYIAVSNYTRTLAKGKKSTLNIYHPVGQNVIYVTGGVAVGDKGSSEDVTMHNPAGLFVTLFKDLLAQHGITVSGNVRTVNWFERELQPVDWKQWTELGFIQSHPFREIIRSVQKPSQNLYTDMMLEHIGARSLNKSDIARHLTGEEAGIHELNKFLDEAGIKHGSTLFQDGSGLSRDNLTTPNATVALLTYMSHRKDFQVYYDALPIAGVDGTLRKRMKGTAAAGNVRAKTGTLRWANAMSGYMTNAAGEHLVFSMMLNRYHLADPEASKTHDFDVVAEMLANFKVRTQK